MEPGGPVQIWQRPLEQTMRGTLVYSMALSWMLAWNCCPQNAFKTALRGDCPGSSSSALLRVFFVTMDKTCAATPENVFSETNPPKGPSRPWKLEPQSRPYLRESHSRCLLHRVHLWGLHGCHLRLQLKDRPAIPTRVYTPPTSITPNAQCEVIHCLSS